MKEKIYKCSFKHCQHESCEVPQGEAVKVGSRHMHKDCAEINENIIKIRDLYYEKISKTVVMKQLVGAINNLIFKKGVDSGLLYFALNHAIQAKIPIKSPYGLHYLVDNHRIKSLWEKKKAKEIVNQMKTQSIGEIQVNKNIENNFKYETEKNNGFADIF